MGIPGLTPYAQKAVPITQKTVTFAGITTSYALVGSIFSNPVVMLIIVSTLDQAVQLSWDGVNDHLPFPALATMVLDFRSDEIAFPGNFGVYVKEIGNPSNGSLYVSAFTL